MFLLYKTFQLFKNCSNQTMLSRFLFSCSRGVRFPSGCCGCCCCCCCFPERRWTPRLSVSTAESSSGIWRSGSELPSPALLLHGASVYRDVRLRAPEDPDVNSEPEKSAPSSPSHRMPSREVRRWKRKKSSVYKESWSKNFELLVCFKMYQKFCKLCTSWKESHWYLKRV